MKNPVGIQLYTLRDLTAKDFPGTLRQVAKAGYRAVEMAGFGGMKARELRTLLDALGLRVAGCHMGIEEIEQNLPGACAFCLELGSPYLIVPAVPVEYRNDGNGFRAAGERLGKAARECRNHGATLVYHTHGFDFQRFGGKLALDVLLDAADTPDLVVEIDTFWAQHQGEDPAQMIREKKGRCPLVHLKDKPSSGPAHDCVIGEGVVDFKAVKQAAEEAGAEWLIVEQEDCRKPPVDCIRESLQNLQRMGIA